MMFWLPDDLMKTNLIDYIFIYDSFRKHNIFLKRTITDNEKCGVEKVLEKMKSQVACGCCVSDDFGNALQAPSAKSNQYSPDFALLDYYAMYFCFDLILTL